MITTIYSGVDITVGSTDKPVVLVRLVESTWQVQFQDGTGRVDDHKDFESALAEAQEYATAIDAKPLDDEDRVTIKQALDAKDKQISQLEARVAELEKLVPAGTEVPADVVKK